MKADLSFKDINGKQYIILKPTDKLSDAEYDAIKPVIESAGGHWREKYEGFIFSLNKMQRSEYAQWQEDIQYFPTPTDIVKEMINWSGLDDWYLNHTFDEKPFILEPSAGQGAIIDEIRNALGLNYREYVIEPCEKNAEVLMSKGHMVQQTTFEDAYKKLKHEPKQLTHVIMNPPFKGQNDIKHIMMAYELLMDGGVLVAVMSENSKYYKTKTTEEFNEFCRKVGAEFKSIPYGAFIESGTSVDTMLVRIKK